MHLCKSGTKHARFCVLSFKEFGESGSQCWFRLCESVIDISMLGSTRTSNVSAISSSSVWLHNCKDRLAQTSSVPQLRLLQFTGFETRAIHSNTAPDAATGARTPMICTSTAFVFNDSAQAGKWLTKQDKNDYVPYHASFQAADSAAMPFAENIVIVHTTRTNRATSILPKRKKTHPSWTPVNHINIEYYHAALTHAAGCLAGTQEIEHIHYFPIRTCTICLYIAVFTRATCQLVCPRGPFSFFILHIHYTPIWACAIYLHM